MRDDKLMLSDLKRWEYRRMVLNKKYTVYMCAGVEKWTSIAGDVEGKRLALLKYGDDKLVLSDLQKAKDQCDGVEKELHPQIHVPDSRMNINNTT
jgi:hypothetical protein